MKNFYLIRHAQSESNAGIIARPNPQINITALGTSQAAALDDWLATHLPAKPAGVFVSPYIRTQQTAAPYLSRTQQNAEVINELHEINIFDFSQIAHLKLEQIGQLAKSFWHENADFKSHENADSFRDFVQRVQQARQRFAQLPDGDYVVFTHGMWIGMLIWQLLHLDGDKVYDKLGFAQFEIQIRPNNCDVYRYQIDSQGTHSIAKIRENFDSKTKTQTM